jgi:hypothetical protein
VRDAVQQIFRPDRPGRASHNEPTWAGGGLIQGLGAYAGNHLDCCILRGSCRPCALGDHCLLAIWRIFESAMDISKCARAGDSNPRPTCCFAYGEASTGTTS